MRRRERLPAARRPATSTATFAAFAGIGAAVVLGIALVVVLSRDSSAPSHAGPAPSPALPPAPPTPVEAAELWSRDAYASARTVEDLRAALLAGTRMGYDKLAGFDWEKRSRPLYERLRKLAPDDPEANRAVGRIPVTDYPDFWTVFRRLVNATSVPEGVAKTRVKFEDRISLRVNERGEYAHHVLPKAEFDELRAALDAFREHEAKRGADPTFAAIADALARVRLDPILGRFDAVHLHVHPFVLCYASRDLLPKDASALERSRVENRKRDLLKRLAGRERLVKEFVAFFEERWRKPLALPEFAPRDLLYVWIFDDHEIYEEYGRARGRAIAPGVVGFFDRNVRWTFVYEEEREPMMIVETLSHELIHHLQWHFSKDPRSAAINHAENLDAVWLSEGWAEYVGAVKTSGEGFLFAQDSQTRMDMIHLCRRLQLPILPLDFVTARTDYADWLVEVSKHLAKVRPNLRPEQRGAALLAYQEVLYAESWLFLKFLHEFDGGKYRSAALKIIESALGGFPGVKASRGFPTARDALVQFLELETVRDWASLQKEFDSFLEAKLYEIPPK